MQSSVMADVEQSHHGDAGKPIRCVVAVKPTEAQKQKKEMLRHVVVIIALLAVLLLVAIAVYYTEGNAVTIRHVSSLAPEHAATRLSLQASQFPRWSR